MTQASRFSSSYAAVERLEQALIPIKHGEGATCPHGHCRRQAQLIIARLEKDMSHAEKYPVCLGSERDRSGDNMTLTERRAEFVYNAARLAAAAAQAPIVPVLWEEREESFRTQFLSVIERQCGPDRSRSPEELHGSWMQAYYAMGWVYGERHDREKRTHPDLVPYAQLGQLERDKDAVFIGLCEIARLYIYEGTWV